LVKKYVVRLSGEERERLESLIRKGKSPARRVLKARILLKADVSEAGAMSRSPITNAADAQQKIAFRAQLGIIVDRQCNDQPLNRAAPY
jgi:hypothetical protein